MTEKINGKKQYRIVGLVGKDAHKVDAEKRVFLVLDEQNGKTHVMTTQNLVMLQSRCSADGFANFHIENDKVSCDECAITRFARYVKDAQGRITVLNEDIHKVYILGEIKKKNKRIGFKVITSSGELLNISKEDMTKHFEDKTLDPVNVHLSREKEDPSSVIIKANKNNCCWEIEVVEEKKTVEKVDDKTKEAKKQKSNKESHDKYLLKLFDKAFTGRWTTDTGLRRFFPKTAKAMNIVKDSNDTKGYRYNGFNDIKALNLLVDILQREVLPLAEECEKDTFEYYLDNIKAFVYNVENGNAVDEMGLVIELRLMLLLLIRNKNIVNETYFSKREKHNTCMYMLNHIVRHLNSLKAKPRRSGSYIIIPEIYNKYVQGSTMAKKITKSGSLYLYDNGVIKPIKQENLGMRLVTISNINYIMTSIRTHKAAAVILTKPSNRANNSRIKVSIVGEEGTILDKFNIRAKALYFGIHDIAKTICMMQTHVNVFVIKNDDKDYNCIDVNSMVTVQKKEGITHRLNESAYDLGMKISEGGYGTESIEEALDYIGCEEEHKKAIMNYLDISNSEDMIDDTYYYTRQKLIWWVAWVSANIKISNKDGGESVFGIPLEYADGCIFTLKVPYGFHNIGRGNIGKGIANVSKLINNIDISAYKYKEGKVIHKSDLIDLFTRAVEYYELNDVQATGLMVINNEVKP